MVPPIFPVFLRLNKQIAKCDHEMRTVLLIPSSSGSDVSLFSAFCFFFGLNFCLFAGGIFSTVRARFRGGEFDFLNENKFRKVPTKLLTMIGKFAENRLRSARERGFGGANFEISVHPWLYTICQKFRHRQLSSASAASRALHRR